MLTASPASLLGDPTLSVRVLLLCLAHPSPYHVLWYCLELELCGESKGSEGYLVFTAHRFS